MSTASRAAVLSASSSAARGRSLGLVAAVGSAIAFAGSGPFVKPLLEAGWTAGGAVFVRVTIAALLLAPLVAWSVRRHPRVLLRRWSWILGYGLIGVAACQLSYFLAVERLPVGIALLLQYLAPIILLLAAWIRTRVRPASLALIGAVLAIAGLLLVIDLTGTTSLDGLGLVFGFLAAVSVCGYFLIGANVPNDLPPIALIGTGLAVAAAVVGLTGATGLVPLAFDLTGTAPLLGSEVPWWVPMGVVVLFGTVGGYLLGVIGAKRLGSRLASFLGLLEVVSVVAVAALLLGEIPTWMQLVGGALILGGVVCARLAPDHQAPVADGGVPDVVGTVTGVIPLPTLRDEHVATGAIHLPHHDRRDRTDD